MAPIKRCRNHRAPWMAARDPPREHRRDKPDEAYRTGNRDTGTDRDGGQENHFEREPARAVAERGGDVLAQGD